MTKEQINNFVEDFRWSEEQMLLLDGFEEAFVGVVGGGAQSHKLCYDANKCIEILEREMDTEEAVEYFEFNVIGAYVGEYTPMFIWRYEK